MDKVILTILTPNVAMMARARSISGRQRNTSMARIINPSSLPPKNPAIEPNAPPAASDIAMDEMPIMSEIRAPWTIRARISRPSSSVPSRFVLLGP
jgi:hypothetical protein